MTEEKLDRLIEALERLAAVQEEIAGQYWPARDDRADSKAVTAANGLVFGPFRGGAVVRVTSDQAFFALSGPDDGITCTTSTGERFPLGVSRYRLRPDCKYLFVRPAANATVSVSEGEKRSRDCG